MLLEQDDEGDKAKARYLLEEPAAISSEPGIAELGGTGFVPTGDLRA